MSRRDDIDFMPELKAATQLRPSMASNLFLLTILGLIIWLLVWMAYAEVDERTRGTGQVVPTSDVQYVQSLEGGILSEILVAEGDRVEKGQVLARIEDIRATSEEADLQSRLASLRAKKARLQSEANETKLQIPADIVKTYPVIAENEQNLYQSRKSELENALAIVGDEISAAKHRLSETKARISQLAKSRDLLNKELEITRKLASQGAVPEIEKIKLEREYATTVGELNAQSQARKALEVQLEALDKKLEERRGAYRSTSLGEMNDVETRISSIEKQLVSKGDVISRTELKSPVTGIIQRIAIKTEGGVVEPAMRLVEIVPIEDELKIRARVMPQDIAFLRPGQEVKVTITAYDPQRYGWLKGKLARISPDTVEDGEGNIFFEIEATTDKNYLGEADDKLKISPGMVAEVEVITGQRTILSYLLKPVFRMRHMAFTEK